MKRILILTAMFACLLLFCDAAQADLYEGKYYIKVTVTDLTADGNYDSCANSAGYIVIPTINQDGSEGETWSVPVPENDWDERNVTREYKGSSDGFPTEIRLVRDDSATSTDYIKSNNKSAKSKIRFTLYVSTNYRDYYEVGSWIEYTSAGGRWSDSKTISSDMYPRRAGMGVFVSGPSTVTAPKPGKSALGYYYTTPVYDQYGAEWYFTNMGLTYSLQNAPDGMSFSRVYNGYLEVTGDVLSHFENGTRNFTIRVSDSFGHSTNEYVVLERPKCTVTLQARYGSEICDPFEVYYDTRVYHDESSDQESALAFSIGAEPIIYPSVDEWPGDQLTNTKHNLFAGWDGMPVSGRITEDTVLRAIYESEEHTWAPNSVRDRLMCTVCGYEEKYPWNRLIEGNGTQDSPYQLRRSAWYNLANAIACGLDYGEYFVLTEDCKAYFPLGTDEYPFTGVIDGNGYSLTLNLIGEYSAPAPLNITGDVIIKNLKIIGTVQGGDWCAGLVSSPGGSVLIENCEVAADITGSGAYSGGFVGHSGANAVTLRNCVFSGSVSCTGEAATFLGWSDAGAVISLHRCMDFSEGGQPLGRGSGSVSADGVFYTDPDKAAGTGSWANVGQIHDTGNYSALAGSTGFANEDFTMLLDGDKNTKWCSKWENDQVCIYIEFDTDEFISPYGYVLTTGNDTATNPGRNPAAWTILGRSSPAEPWTMLDSVTGDTSLPEQNNEDTFFFISNPTSAQYRFFRFEITALRSGDIFQLSELKFEIQSKRSAGPYSITVTPSDQNAVSAPDEAKEGDIVTLTITEGQGALSALSEFLKVIGPEGEIEFTEEYTFIMPAGDVTVSIVTTSVFGEPDFTLPAFLTTIEEEAFEGAAMSVVYIPDGCAAIGEHAFRNCMSLTQIRIPDGCTIGADAFDGCTLVYVYGRAGSQAETYCQTHTNCVFVEEAEEMTR